VVEVTSVTGKERKGKERKGKERKGKEREFCFAVVHLSTYPVLLFLF
jgi:hypothetical protein